MKKKISTHIFFNDSNSSVQCVRYTVQSDDGFKNFLSVYNFRLLAYNGLRTTFSQRDTCAIADSVKIRHTHKFTRTTKCMSLVGSTKLSTQHVSALLLLLFIVIVLFYINYILLKNRSCRYMVFTIDLNHERFNLVKYLTTSNQSTCLIS